MPKKNKNNQISKGCKKSTTFRIKTHFVVRFIAWMIRVRMVYLCYTLVHQKAVKTHIDASKHNNNNPCRKRVKWRKKERSKFMWWPQWSWINSRKRKQKADKVNEQRSHINRIFKLINRGMHFMGMVYYIPVWSDAIRCDAMQCDRSQHNDEIKGTDDIWLFILLLFLVLVSLCSPTLSFSSLIFWILSTV